MPCSALSGRRVGGAESHSVMALYHMYDCVTERVGYSMAPMTNLRLNGRSPDLAFQKILNTFSKRHHVRFWHDERSGLWLGAATEDVKYAVQGMHLTHATDRRVDNERAKVVNDLVFTGCVDAGALLPRPGLKTVTDTTSIVTDGDVAVLRLNGCEQARTMPERLQVARPNRAVRSLLAVAKDVARSNPITVGRAFAAAMMSRQKTSPESSVDGGYRRASAITEMPQQFPMQVAGR